MAEYMLQNKDKKGKWEDTGISFNMTKEKATARYKKLIKDGYLSGLGTYRLRIFKK